MSSDPVSSPGGIFAHIRELASAVREKDWAAALGYALELLHLVEQDLDNIGPCPMQAAQQAPPTPEKLAARLESCCPPEGGEAQPVQFGGWATLLPLVLQALSMIFSKGQ